MNISSYLSGDIALIAGVSFTVGYAIFLILLILLPRKLRRENLEQREQILANAQRRREHILAEQSKRFEHKLALTREEMEESINDRTQDLSLAEEELGSREESISQTESRVAREEKEVSHYQAKVEVLAQKYEEEAKKVQECSQLLQQRLEVMAGTRAEEIRKNLVERSVADRQLESQKQLKELVDELESHSKKLADRMLSRLLSRYAPRFVWPKSSNHVEIADPKLVEILQSESQTLLPELRELSEQVQIELSADEEHPATIIKLGGGYGIYREAAKLTLEELLPRGPGAWSKASQTFHKHRLNIEKIALKLGRQAVRELQLEGMHEEILKMVGALNWRTSYRQNQFYHSLEVAKLAGILATELGVDPDMAKRCGLLHDIGKGIDYRIEGSHAVISGDYADRFGERRIICDTVMSHHNDLVLETPLAYVLKSADTLSGARPGARVNLEEGYQIRLSAIDQAVRSFPGITKVAIMSGGREVHIDVHYKKIKEEDIESLTKAIARKIEEEVAFPGQIKVLVTRRFEATAVA